jgi:two-component system, NarL family, response regulator NreC
MTNKLRVLLADDHQMFREGLRAIINSQTDMTVVGEADNGQAAVTLGQELQPDIVVMDISMPEMNGLKATERLKQLCPAINILTLTRHADAGYLQQVLKAGANGYVLKRSASEELVRAIRAVASGQSYLDPAVTNQALSGLVGRKGASAFPADRDLSPREEEVLRMLAAGYANKEIAARLALSVKTIEAHRANAMGKLGMKSRIDVVRYAMLQGWLEES